MVRRLVGWLVGWLVGRLVGWLVVWLDAVGVRAGPQSRGLGLVGFGGCGWWSPVTLVGFGWFQSVSVISVGFAWFRLALVGSFWLVG